MWTNVDRVLLVVMVEKRVAGGAKECRPLGAGVVTQEAPGPLEGSGFGSAVHGQTSHGCSSCLSIRPGRPVQWLVGRSGQVAVLEGQ